MGIDINNIYSNGTYKLLNLDDYLKVYQPPLKDNYQIKNKNKKDEEKINLILEKKLIINQLFTYHNNA